MNITKRPTKVRVAVVVTAAALATGGAVAASSASSASGLPVQVGNVKIVPTTSSKAPGTWPTADVKLVQSGGLLDATGTGTGFSKDGIYLSVLYGYGSNATTCTPDGTLNFGQMLLGIWEPTGSTTRTLVAPPKLDQGYSGVTLSKVDYVSIRETSTMLVQSTAQQLGQTFQLASCGVITKSPSLSHILHGLP